MAGRMVILPKKSYCPWKPENLERIVKDERSRKEKEDATDEANRRATSSARWNLLKKRKQQEQHQQVHNGNSTEDTKISKSSNPTTSNISERQTLNCPTQKRFNLFDVEEKRELTESKLDGAEIIVSKETRPSKDQGTKRPFYLRDSPYDDTRGYTDRQTKRKAETDPMKCFVSEEVGVSPSPEVRHL